MLADVADPSFIFWSSGCEDFTTIVIREDEVVQLDINDKRMADEDGHEHIPIVDELAACRKSTGVFIDLRSGHECPRRKSEA